MLLWQEPPSGIRPTHSAWPNSNLKWTPLSRPFFAINLLMSGGSELFRWDSLGIEAAPCHSGL